ncbi:uncharacterized protein AB675_9986 [Cyphellophora attinorum]|uniref:N-acetyltransferase domain-containing protein n=1 Tax=Cyphellophora attinorum TaxID=1664694 RepID=A0A0N1HJI9_9EURO|nr:uncharacterized protein AB675_9986 [Phialophora attinorum]KPI36643.1 hypothetical protein AB675_9986 [Phialophora attinorum]
MADASTSPRRRESLLTAALRNSPATAVLPSAISDWMASNALAKVKICALNTARLTALLIKPRDRNSILDPEIAWTCSNKFPTRFNANMITLGGPEPDKASAQTKLVNQLIDRGLIDNWEVLDSWATLKLELWGLTKKFEGEWLWLDVREGSTAGGVHYTGEDVRKVVDMEELAEFEEAWWKSKAGIANTETWYQVRDVVANAKRFRDFLLDDQHIQVWTIRDEEAVIAGCVTYISDGVVSISDVSLPPRAHRADRLRLRKQFVTMAARGGLPVVGWSDGQGLADMKELGFQSVGKMQVWERKAA